MLPKCSEFWKNMHLDIVGNIVGLFPNYTVKGMLKIENGDAPPGV